MWLGMLAYGHALDFFPVFLGGLEDVFDLQRTFEHLRVRLAPSAFSHSIEHRGMTLMCCLSGFAGFFSEDISTICVTKTYKEDK